MVGTRNTAKSSRKEPTVRVTLSMRDRHANAARHAGVQIPNPQSVQASENEIPTVTQIPSPVTLQTNNEGTISIPQVLPPPPALDNGVSRQQGSTSPEVTRVYPTTPQRDTGNEYGLQSPLPPLSNT